MFAINLLKVKNRRKDLESSLLLCRRQAVIQHESPSEFFLFPITTVPKYPIVKQSLPQRGAVPMHKKHQGVYKREEQSWRLIF